MHDVVIAIPFLFLAAIIGLPLAAMLRGRVRTRAPRAPRAPRPRKSKLHVTRSQIDKDLQDLIRRRP
jgi:hypothetical protein